MVSDEKSDVILTDLPHQPCIISLWPLSILVFAFSFQKFNDEVSWTLTFFLNFILYSRFLLVIYFIHICVYMSIPTSQFIPLPPPHLSRFPHLVFLHLFSKSVFLLLPCKLLHLYNFSRFHIYALIYDIFLFLTCFTLYDSL